MGSLKWSGRGGERTYFPAGGTGSIDLPFSWEGFLSFLSLFGSEAKPRPKKLVRLIRVESESESETWMSKTSFSIELGCFFIARC